MCLCVCEGWGGNLWVFKFFQTRGKCSLVTYENVLFFFSLWILIFSDEGEALLGYFMESSIGPYFIILKNFKIRERALGLSTRKKKAIFTGSFILF